jgi:hypothetical protein
MINNSIFAHKRYCGKKSTKPRHDRRHKSDQTQARWHKSDQTQAPAHLQLRTEAI